MALLAHIWARPRLPRLARAAWWAAAGGLFCVFACWPQFWNLSQSGLTPAQAWSGTGRATYFAAGQQHPGAHEFHWHGLQLLAGNSFVLAGLACLAALAVAALLPSSRGCLLSRGSAWPAGAPGTRAVTDGTSLAGLRERLVVQVLQTSGIRDERIAARCATCHGTCSCRTCRPRTPTSTTPS